MILAAIFENRPKIPKNMKLLARGRPKKVDIADFWPFLGDFSQKSKNVENLIFLTLKGSE